MDFDVEYLLFTYYHSNESPHLGSGRDCEDVEAREKFNSLQSMTQAMGIDDTNNVQSIAS